MKRIIPKLFIIIAVFTLTAWFLIGGYSHSELIWEQLSIPEQLKLLFPSFEDIYGIPPDDKSLLHYRAQPREISSVSGIMVLERDTCTVKAGGRDIGGFRFSYSFYNGGRYRFVYSLSEAIRKNMDKLTGHVVMYSGKAKVYSTADLEKENKELIYSRSSMPAPEETYVMEIETIDAVDFITTRLPDAIDDQAPLDLELYFYNPFKEKRTVGIRLTRDHHFYYREEVELPAGEIKKVPVRLVPVHKTPTYKKDHFGVAVHLWAGHYSDIYIFECIGLYENGKKIEEDFRRLMK